MKRPAWIFDTRSIINIKAEKIGFKVWQLVIVQIKFMKCYISIYYEKKIICYLWNY